MLARQPFQIQDSALLKKHMIMELRWRLYLARALWLSLSRQVVFRAINSILADIFRKRQAKGKKRLYRWELEAFQLSYTSLQIGLYALSTPLWMYLDHNTKFT